MTRSMGPGKTWWSRGHLERLDHNPAGLSVPIPEHGLRAQWHVINVHSGKRLGERKNSRVVFQDVSGRGSGEELEVPGLAQEHDAKGVIQLSVSDEDSFDRHMPDTCRNGPR